MAKKPFASYLQTNWGLFFKWELSSAGEMHLPKMKKALR